jgi:hypothetical protein
MLRFFCSERSLAKTFYQSGGILADDIVVIPPFQDGETATVAFTSGVDHHSSHGVVVLGMQQSTPIIQVMVETR